MVQCKRLGAALLVVLLLLVLIPAGVYAHRMIIEQDGDTLLVRYDDRTIASRATVRLYNANDEVIWEGPVDSEGRVGAPRSFAKAVAEDGLGHRTTYISGQVQKELPRPLAAGVGVSFFIFVAALGRYLSMRKPQNSPADH